MLCARIFSFLHTIYSTGMLEGSFYYKYCLNLHKWPKIYSVREPFMQNGRCPLSYWQRALRTLQDKVWNLIKVVLQKFYAKSFHCPKIEYPEVHLFSFQDKLSMSTVFRCSVFLKKKQTQTVHGQNRTQIKKSISELREVLGCPHLQNWGQFWSIMITRTRWSQSASEFAW